MTEQLSLRERIQVGSVEAAKIACAAVFSAIAVAPHAAEHAVETTTVETQVAEFPAELSFYPGTTRVDVLNQANVYVDRTKADIGMRAKITGLPRFDGTGQVLDYFSPKRLNVYASMADSPQEVVAGYEDELLDAARQSALEYELKGIALGTFLIYGGGLALNWRRRAGANRNLPELGKLGIAGLATMAVAGSFSVASSHRADWLTSQPKPANLVPIHALDNTSLAGASSDNPQLVSGINNSIKYADLLKERRAEKREAYLATATPELTAGIQALPDLREHEELFFVMTDMHSSKAGIELAGTSIATLQDRYGKDALRTVLNLGDASYGADFQRQSVLDQRFKSLPVEVLFTRGNHDVGKVPSWLKEAGMIDTKGYTTVNGITVYGKPDVQLTPFLDEPFYPNPMVTEDVLGQDVAAHLVGESADVLDLHQPNALAAALGIGNMTEYLASDEDTSLTTCDYGAGSLSSIQVSLANAGHWHDQYPLKMICNTDGTWGIVNVQGTGGGANEAPTINDWSDPDGKPLRTVSFRAFIRNTEYNSITGVINIQIKTGGHIAPIVRTNIGTYNGAPFSKIALADAKNKQNAHP